MSLQSLPSSSPRLPTFLGLRWHPPLPHHPPAQASAPAPHPRPLESFSGCHSSSRCLLAPLTLTSEPQREQAHPTGDRLPGGLRRVPLSSRHCRPHPAPWAHGDLASACPALLFLQEPRCCLLPEALREHSGVGWYFAALAVPISLSAAGSPVLGPTEVLWAGEPPPRPLSWRRVEDSTP